MSARMKARVRHRREREVDTVTETPISLRSKFAWVTIVLMVLVIVAASIRTHPYHYRVDYAMTKTGENPYMGTLDAEDGYLVSANWSWVEAEPADGEYAAPELEPLQDGARYVLLFDATDAPTHVTEAAQQASDPGGVHDRPPAQVHNGAVPTAGRGGQLRIFSDGRSA